ncbi:MAG: cell division protein FtsZ [Rhizobiales bacterium]|nr:cell division protein FtsZ [Hyphomicrobiales bacterium]
MTINLTIPDVKELSPRITVFGVGGAGGNAVNNMIQSGLQGVEFVVANTDSQALAASVAERRIQMGTEVTQGLGAGSHPEIGRAAAQESIDEIKDQLNGAHMAFVTAGMGGGTGTGAAPVIAGIAREQGILTVGVVTKPFQFEGRRRQQVADAGIEEMHQYVDTLIVIPNQNLFRIANEKTTFADAFAMADQVLYSGVACITDLIVKEGLINLDFADVRAVMDEMGKAMMGTGEASGEKRAIEAAEAAISNPLLDDVSMRGARGLLISITGGHDLTLYEVDEAAMRIREEVDEDANIILGATFDDTLEGVMRVSVVATGIEAIAEQKAPPVAPQMPDDVAQKLRALTAEINGDAPGADPAPAPEVQMNETTRDGVTIQPFVPAPDAAPEPAVTSETAEPAAENFIPPVAEKPEARTPRMPRTEELPVPAQNQLRALQGEAPSQGLAAQQKKTGFLSRLASVGISRREPEEETVRAAAPQEPQLQERAAPAAPAPVKPAPAAVPMGNVETRRIAGSSDGPPEMEDDRLEIPAFLRRQAN